MTTEGFDPRKLYRSEGPLESAEAASTVKSYKSEHEEIIFAALVAAPTPLTTEEIAAMSTLTHPQVWRRMASLAERGWIRRAGFGRNANGRKAATWEVVPREDPLQDRS